MAITRIILVSISIFFLSGCISESDHQGKEFTSLIKNRALAIEFDKFINSEKVKDLCAKTTHCVIEIAFFPRDGNCYLLLSANQFKSVTPPGALNPEQGFVFLGFKYIILLNDGFSEIDKFINLDILNPAIPEILSSGEK